MVNELTEAWRNTYVSTITVGQLALGKTMEDVFNLSVMKGLITTFQEVTLSPFETQTVATVSKVTGHVKQMHVIAEPKEPGFYNEVIAQILMVTLNLGLAELKFACKIWLHRR